MKNKGKKNPRVSSITNRDEGTFMHDGIEYNWAELLDLFSDYMSATGKQSISAKKALQSAREGLEQVEREWSWFRPALTYILKPLIEFDRQGLEPVKRYTLKEFLDFMKELNVNETAITKYYPRRKRP